MWQRGWRWLTLCLALGVCLGLWRGEASAQARQPIDPSRSAVTVHLERGGLFSFFGDNHRISGPVASGWVQASAPLGVEFRIDAIALRVLDPWLSESDRAKVQERMLGPEVLDAERYPAITFASTSVVAAGEQEWTVSGRLALRGATRDVRVPVKYAESRYRGSVRIRQTDFGIRPVTIAMGTVRVKDEILIEFDIATPAGIVSGTSAYVGPAAQSRSAGRRLQDPRR